MAGNGQRTWFQASKCGPQVVTGATGVTLKEQQSLKDEVFRRRIETPLVTATKQAPSLACHATPT